MSERLRNLANLWRGGSGHESEYADDIFALFDGVARLREQIAGLTAERDRLHNAGGFLYSTLSLVQSGAGTKDDMQQARDAWVRAIRFVYPDTDTDAALTASPAPTPAPATEERQ